MAKLTKRFIDSIRTPDREYIVWDERLSGFGLRVKPSGVKSFVLQYRDHIGRSKRLTIGRYADPFTAEQAFQFAREEKAILTLGGDPASERKTKRGDPTIAEFCKVYLADAEAGRVLTRYRRPKSPSTLATDRGRIDAHIIPLLGKKRLNEITRQDVKQFAEDVANGKTAKNLASKNLRGRTVVTGGQGTARRTVGLLQGILTYALEEQLIGENPATNLKLPTGKRRRVENVPATYAALGRALKIARRRNDHWQAKYLIRLIALTGLRKSEALNLRVGEVDTLRSAIDLERSKTGESIRPVSSVTMSLLREAIEMSDGAPYVFPGVRDKSLPYGGLPNAWRRIVTDEALSSEDRQLLAHCGIHKLRHMMITVANGEGVPLATVGSLAGHSVGGTTAGYISPVEKYQREAAELISTKILEMLAVDSEPEPTTKGDNVLNLQAFR